MELNWLIQLLHPPVSHAVSHLPSLPKETTTRALLACIIRHRTPGLAWHKIAPHADALPGDLVNGLREMAIRNTQRALAHTAETIRLYTAFQNAGLDALPLKGACLSQQIYCSPGLRYAGDIDILVAESRLSEADHTLQQLGYERVSPGFPWSDSRARLYRWHTHTAYYRHATRCPELELHWRLHANPSLHPIDYDAFRDTCETVMLADKNMPVLPPAEQLVYLCSHGARHNWRRLHWLCDLPPLMQLVDANDQRDWFQHRVRSLGLERTVQQSLTLCDRIWPDMTPSPLSFCTSMTSDRATAILVRNAETALSMPEIQHPRSWKQICADTHSALLLKRSWSYKLQYLSRLLLYTNELNQSRLRGPFTYLHFVLRPARWIKRRLQRRLMSLWRMTGNQ